MISFNERADNLIVKIRLFLEFRNTSRNEEIECINETWGKMMNWPTIEIIM